MHSFWFGEIVTFVFISWPRLRMTSNFSGGAPCLLSFTMSYFFIADIRILLYSEYTLKHTLLGMQLQGHEGKEQVGKIELCPFSGKGKMLMLHETKRRMSVQLQGNKYLKALFLYEFKH